MARKKKTPEPIPMPQRRPTPVEPVERVERCGHIDQPLLLMVLLLLGLGLIAMFSASYATAYASQEGDATFFIAKQAMLAAGGLGAMLFLGHKFDYHKLIIYGLLSLPVAVLIMATIKIPGLSSMWETINGATRWMRVPGVGSFQPSELTKVAVIFSFSSLATLFGRKKMRTFRWGILPFMGIIGVFALEMMWQRHLSGTLIIAAVGMIIIFFAGSNLFWFGLGGCGIAAAGIWYIFSRSYAMDRIRVWLDPFIDPQGDGWQGVQSQLAIGSGGFWGLGLGQGIQKHLYLPEPANDFVFAVWCEEMGFVGAVIVVVLFAMLIWRGYYIALNASDRYGTLLAAGITTQIAVQAFLNLCVVTGLLPITGASLPFFSYGGTALLIQLVEMGILLAISKDIPAPREG